MNALEITGSSVPGRIQSVDWAVAAGTLVGLIGPNGSGKSTLLQVAAGLLPSSGSVRWEGTAVAGIPALERGRRTAWVPQESRFEFGFSVRSVIAQGRYAHGDDGKGVDEALLQLDLAPLSKRPVNHLSGGERHRVLLARALATGARLQLWDEPLGALDVRHALEVLALARRLASRGTTVILSLHDLRVATTLDAVALMHSGRLLAFGPPAGVLTAERLREVFGVRSQIAPGLCLDLP